MFRRGIVAGLVLLLGIALATMLTGCFEEEEIWHCLRDGTASWFGRAPLTVCFEAEVDYQGVVAWEFGDGATGAGEIVNHTYTEPGTYEVVMDVVYPSGKMVTLTETVVVAEDPVAAFTYKAVPPRPAIDLWFSRLFSWLNQDAPEDEPEEEPAESLEVEFDASDSTPAQNAVLHQPDFLVWDFGDGTSETVGVSNSSWFFLFSRNDMVIRHTYPAAGVYEVTMTLTDNLGFSDSVTRMITVGTPGAPDDDEEDDLADQFTLISDDWELDDEEEEGCLSIYGSVNNAGPLAAGVELTATAYAGAVEVGTITHWPAGAANITVGIDFFYVFFLCDLSVPAEQVTSVEVVISDGVAY